jgi:Flp pilus assembly protein TadD
MLAEDEASGHGMDREFAMLYASRGIKADKAEAYARKEYAKRPNSIDAQFSLAIACYRAGKLDEAQAMIDKTMHLKGKNPEHFAYAGLIADQRGDKAKAALYAKEALRINRYLSPMLNAEVQRLLQS